MDPSRLKVAAERLPPASPRLHAELLEAAHAGQCFLPDTRYWGDPAKIRDWAQAAEDLGYTYIEVPDHVFGATAWDGWVPLYSEKDSFHETFVMLGFLAAVTKNIRLSSRF
jgi:alkanesulfonate monooxygenase SsuD/methylene tetrahydromethanopterin reductase-like flavin-dependent oxidoreductase (luciferase family)